MAGANQRQVQHQPARLIDEPLAGALPPLSLASLSSNPVRVESLFIDKGCGNLDADTLRVVMDALDGLQAMGRKVDVMSHVQEMTEQIGVKILVLRTNDERSQLAITEA